MTLPLVLVPGLACTGDLYRHQLSRLGTARPVMVADHTRDDTMGAIAERLLAAAPERFALGGVSMGGYVAFEVLGRAPQRVARAIFMSTSARPDTPARSEGRRAQVKAARAGHYREGTMALWPLLVHPARFEDLALRALTADMADEVGVDGFARQIEAIIGRADSRPLLASIACPTLVIVGAQDALIPPENGAEIAVGIPGARLETLADCGHMTPAEKPETVTRLIGDFLAA
jgi:pimeloyl-ACP methyl ester carboxylesterase